MKQANTNSTRIDIGKTSRIRQALRSSHNKCLTLSQLEKTKFIQGENQSPEITRNKAFYMAHNGRPMYLK